jgi:5-methylcytosine-specific restriction enzyme A
MARHEQRSLAALAYRHLYKTAAWLAARAAQLRKQPLCERCLVRGLTVAATIVNHRIPHKGDWRLFIDPDNHESACKPCHDGLIQREERRGYAIGVSAEGRPKDPNHPWNRPPG